MRGKLNRDRDRDLLRHLSDREARVADAATRLAYDLAADWLATRSAKAASYPGGDLARAQGRAAAYWNASQELAGWAARSEEA